MVEKESTLSWTDRDRAFFTVISFISYKIPGPDPGSAKNVRNKEKRSIYSYRYAIAPIKKLINNCTRSSAPFPL